MLRGTQQDHESSRECDAYKAGVPLGGRGLQGGHPCCLGWEHGGLAVALGRFLVWGNLLSEYHISQ